MLFIASMMPDSNRQPPPMGGGGSWSSMKDRPPWALGGCLARDELVAEVMVLPGVADRLAPARCNLLQQPFRRLRNAISSGRGTRTVPSAASPHQNATRTIRSVADAMNTINDRDLRVAGRYNKRRMGQVREVFAQLDRNSTQTTTAPESGAVAKTVKRGD